jgi:hypothetical protein
MLTRRLDTAGTTIWTTTYDNAGLADGAVSLSSRSGALFVAGGTQTTSTAYKIATWKINATSGAISTTTLSSSSSIGIDRVNDVQEDASGNVFVAGTVYNLSTGFDYKVFKYDVNLSLLWSATWNGTANLDDAITGLAVASNGSVLVTGFTSTTSQGKNFATVKYNSTGTQQWVSTFDGGGNDSATCIVINSTDTNKIYVSGYSYNGSTNDYYTIRYNGSGTALWKIGFNSLQNGNDIATAIALDTLGNVIVTGQNQISPTTRIYTTVKYLEKNTTMPKDTVATISTSYFYTENRGQLLNSDTLPATNIKFYTLHSTPKIFFTDTATSYVFFKIDTATVNNDSAARVDMKFVGANSNLKIRPLDAKTDYENFYRGIIPHGRERVQDFNQLVSFNVWNGVDMIYGSNLKGMKYYFICKPVGGGSSYSSIDLKYEGADSVRINGSGQLVIYTKYGSVIQPKAAAWQLDASGNYSSLGWQPSYNIIGTNEINFTSLGSYNNAYPLVFAIDWGNPTTQSTLNLDWSSYYGGDEYDNFYKLDIDQTAGMLFVAGESQSTTFPTSTGAYQGLFSGGWDAILVKFNTAGVRQFATYYGTGPSNFSAVSSQLCRGGLAVNQSNGHVFIGGSSQYVGYNIGLPNTQPAGAYVDTTAVTNNVDGYIAEFSSTGGLVWATYYGGSGTSGEMVNDMGFDASGNLYVVMDADSLTPHKYLAGAYNDSTNKTGMIVKFDQNRVRKWATNFSTRNGGHTYRLAFTGNTVYVSGTAKAGLPFKYPGIPAYIDSTLGGTQDAFIAKFNANDSLVWCTYVGGSGTEDGYGMSARTSDIFLTGVTKSTDFPHFHYSGMYIDSTLDGTSDVFLMRFKSNCERVWSTYYGGNNREDQITRAVEDTLGNVYFSGSSQSTNFPNSCLASVYCDATLGNASFSDAFLLTFNPLNQRIWSTYFGGYHHEGAAQGLGIYSNNLLFICGRTESRNTATPPFPLEDLGNGAWYQFSYTDQFVSGSVGRFTLAPIQVGIYETQQNQSTFGSLFVFPNPSNGEFQVTINSDTKNRKIEVYNSIGQLLETRVIADGLASQTISLNLSEEATGIYFIVLRDANGICSKKIIKN